MSNIKTLSNYVKRYLKHFLDEKDVDIQEVIEHDEAIIRSEADSAIQPIRFKYSLLLP